MNIFQMPLPRPVTKKLLNSKVLFYCGKQNLKMTKSCTAEVKSKIDSPGDVSLDTALTLIGYGKFHYKIMISCAFCFISSGVQYGLTAYAMPAAHCELDLSSTQIGFVNSSFLIGAMCSSFLWGVTADLTGRKKILTITLLSNAVVTIFCAFVQNLIGLIACRFINGFLIGAPGSVAFTYMAEFHAPTHRTKAIYYAGIFFTVPWLLLPALAWVILPLQVNLAFADFTLLSSWRLFLIILSLPEIIGGLWLWHLPETPKFLAVARPEKALSVLREMYKVNKNVSEAEFPIKTLNEVQINLNTNANENKVNSTCKIAKLAEEIFCQIYDLFKTPLLSSTFLVTLLMFTNMFGYYGLGLWLPEVLNRKKEGFSNITNSSNKFNDTCTFQFDRNLYQSTVIIGVSALCANLFAGWLSGKFQPKTIPIATSVLSATCAGWMFWASNPLQYLIASCIFQSAMSVANISFGTVAVELFPTNVNAIAVCTVMLAGRLGAIFSNIIFGFLIDANPTIAISLVIGVLVICTFACFFIPNKKEKKSAENKPNVVFSISTTW
ncbi:hypothetical protein FQA39_LY02287 [Lamprigera yunnana]|nr:hypothetical protein FQA39_LY02287 [Lamprigera yunnana]